jgi:hypothetical protein
MRDGSIVFTELFAIAMVLELTAEGLWDLMNSASKPLFTSQVRDVKSVKVDSMEGDEGWPYVLTGLFFWVGAACTAATYYRSSWSTESRTIKLYMVFYAYLFVIGSEDMMYRLLGVFYYRSAFSTWAYLFGPIHIIPTGTMILFRPKIHGELGKRWLQQ